MIASLYQRASVFTGKPLSPGWFLFLSAGAMAANRELLIKDGERGRNRTYNLLIKSQLLCQLSYAPTVGNRTGGQFVIVAFPRTHGHGCCRRASELRAKPLS